jgi:hypothetical protein
MSARQLENRLETENEDQEADKLMMKAAINHDNSFNPQYDSPRNIQNQKNSDSSNRDEEGGAAEEEKKEGGGGFASRAAAERIHQIADFRGI